MFKSDRSRTVASKIALGNCVTCGPGELSFLKEEKLFWAGGEVVFVGEDFSKESITGKDRLIKGSLKFPDGRVVENAWAHEFHDYEELFFIFSKLLLHGGEVFATLKNIVWCQGVDLLTKQGYSLLEEAVTSDRVINIHFNRLHSLLHMARCLADTDM